MEMHHSHLITEFIARHQLPEQFAETVEHYYLPLASWLAGRRQEGSSFLLGINGAQGTGKSTLSDFLKMALESARGWQVAVLSIDDFYLTREERRQLAAKVHPLLSTRGVPGTHDTRLLGSYLARLPRLRDGETIALPRFDKSEDERSSQRDWPVVGGPLDLIIFEGWCVGSVPQRKAELEHPINALEREEDPMGIWRRYVNTCLDKQYSPLFADLDALVFLMAPSFDAVYRWRMEQEKKLAAAISKDASAIMSDSEISRFIQHYERLTQANKRTLPDLADVVLELNENHDCTRSLYRN